VERAKLPTAIELPAAAVTSVPMAMAPPDKAPVPAAERAPR